MQWREDSKNSSSYLCLGEFSNSFGFCLQGYKELVGYGPLPFSLGLHIHAELVATPPLALLILSGTGPV